jgi:hypothetical protein
MSSLVTYSSAKLGQVLEVTSAAEVGGVPTVVMEVALLTCQLMECTLGGTSVEHPQYYLLKVLTQPSFYSPLLPPIDSVGTILGDHNTHKSIERHVTKPNQVVLKRKAQSSPKQLCYPLIGINMMKTILCHVIELSDVLIHIVCPLL